MTRRASATRPGGATRRVAWPLAAVAVALLAVAAGLQLPHAPTVAARLRPAVGGSVRLALPALPGRLDPLRAVTQAERAVASLVYDTLVRLDGAGRPRPHLALGWRRSPDRRVLTFWLRPGVPFHGGRSLRAIDVARSLERLADPSWGSGLAWILDGVEGVRAFTAGRAREITGLRVVGAYQLELHFERPSDLLPAALAHPQAAIVPADAAAADPSAPPAEVPGTGPFRPVWTAGRLDLVANTEHFAGRPFLDRVEIVVEPDAARALFRLDIGEVDVVPLVGARREGGLRASGSGGLVALIWINAERSPLGDRRIRRALGAAIDRESLVEALVPGASAAAALLPDPLGVPRRSGGRGEAALREAREAVEEALGPGRRLRPLVLLAPADQTPMVRVAERLQVNFLDIGAEVRLELLPAAALERRVAARDYDLALALWAPGVADPLAAHLAAAVRSGEAAAAVAQAARAGLAAAELDVKARWLLEAEAALAEAAPLVPLYHPAPAVWHRPDLFGLTAGPAGEPRLADAWLDPRPDAR